MLLDLKNGNSPYDTAILLPAGTAANPAVQVGGPGAGIYSTGTTNLSATIGGTQILSIDSTGITVTGTITSTGGDALGDITVASITGSDASLDIAGLAAAQGGSISIVGGVSATTGNAGGAVNLTGAAGTGVGTGGAVVIAAGASGSGATGTGGALTVRAGASAATNGAGGALTVTAGAGHGTGTGGALIVAAGAGGAGVTGDAGAISIRGGSALSTDGAGGAAELVAGIGTGSGAGGAAYVTANNGAIGGVVAITAGASSAGAGPSVTITAGAGGGSTNSGGNVNLVPGAAVSTGNPGELQVNGNSSMSFATYYFTGTPAATDQVFFVAPRTMRVKTISCVFAVAAGGTSTLTVIKDTGTSAPGAGTSLHQSGSFNLAATANTTQTATVATTIATVNMAAGDRLAVKFANAIQSTAGLVVTVGMVPI